MYYFRKKWVYQKQVKHVLTDDKRQLRRALEENESTCNRT